MVQASNTPERPRSISWVVVAAMQLIAVVGWGFMAAEHAHNEDGWRTEGADSTERVRIRQATRLAFADFVINAVVQVPNCPAVIASTFRDRIWLPIAIVALEGLMVFFGLTMKIVERKLAAPTPSRKLKGPTRSW